MVGLSKNHAMTFIRPATTRRPSAHGPTRTPLWWTQPGYDAGAATIAEHLTRDPAVTKVPAVATIWRVLSRRGFITPQPHKRHRSAWKRFCADQPNELWQADVTHWHLADGTTAEILNLLDDHSRLVLASLARPTGLSEQRWI